MKIGLYYMISSTDASIEADKENREYLSLLSKEIGIEFEISDLDHIKNYPLSFVFAGTGGVEGIFLKAYKRLPQPVFLLTTGHSNSLAASMEILSFLRQKNIVGEIIHGSFDYVKKRVIQICHIFEAKERICSLRLARVGKPSDWLISSNVDAQSSKQINGIEIIDISMEEFYQEIRKNEYPNNQYVELFKTGKFNENEKEKALYIYGALKRLVAKYHLNGVTVKCFDLLDTVKSTGCVGLALLNAEGIYASCEGDTPALISMAILGELTGQPVFMANPSELDTDNNEIIFAHCTLPINMISKFELMTHYESQIGVAFRGKIDEGACTVFKTDGLLQQYFASKGEIIENLSRHNLCRTQIRIKMDQPVDYFLKESIGNHHLIIKGDYVDLIDEFYKYL